MITIFVLIYLNNKTIFAKNSISLIKRYLNIDLIMYVEILFKIKKEEKYLLILNHLF